MVTLLSAATATTSAPSAATDGVSVHPTDSINWGLRGANKALLLLESTAGSDTMTVTIKLWGYNPTAGKWYPLGTSSTASSKGVINEASAMGETGTDVIAHTEVVNNIRAFSRMAAQVTAIGGTDTAITVKLTDLE